MTNIEKTYCSEVCSAQGEPLAGTAIQVDVWIMLEYRRAWSAKAVADNQLQPTTNAWLTKTVSDFAAIGLVARPQFIRRPERTETQQLFVSYQGRLGGLKVASESDLHQLDLVTTELEAVRDTQYFVCVNAKRDICCAKFGRPTYAALHKILKGRAWQTTHVGGHRYAPNILVLPQSALYGRVTPGDVPEFLAATENNRLARGFLRGQTRYSAIAQIAEHTIINAQELLSESSDQATFSTPDGARSVTVGPALESIEVLPSCGKDRKSITPLIAQPERNG